MHTCASGRPSLESHNPPRSQSPRDLKPTPAIEGSHQTCYVIICCCFQIMMLLTAFASDAKTNSSSARGGGRAVLPEGGMDASASALGRCYANGSGSSSRSLAAFQTDNILMFQSMYLSARSLISYIPDPVITKVFDRIFVNCTHSYSSQSLSKQDNDQIHGELKTVKKF